MVSQTMVSGIVWRTPDPNGDSQNQNLNSPSYLI